MRLSHSIFKTERDAPGDAQLISQQLLIRAGLVRQISSGIYSLTPLAFRTLSKIAEIAREEMSRAEGQEVLLPVVQPASLWKQSGRYEKIDASMARWQDRNTQDMVLAMTHEEAVTDLIRHFVNSYRQLPIMVYQIQTKFRDEPRPRGGLVRLREFMMKDAYSFHADTEDLDVFYNRMIEAYEKFYHRCGVNVLRVEADTGMMGGGISHEFMVLSDGGEDTLLTCRTCGYAANREVAVSHKRMRNATEAPAWRLYIDSNGRHIVVGTPTTVSISEVKLARTLGIAEVREANTSELEQFNLPLHDWLNIETYQRQGVSVVLDDSFASHFQSKGYHLADVISAEGGDHCLRCGSELEAVRGIEVGNIFKLGTQYTLPMQANFTQRDGSLHPLVMGCYGIGITRMLACIIEDNHDEHGIVFPESIAPYKYHLVQLGTDADVIHTAEKIYNQLGAEQVLYDDRNATPGVKFTDSDLLGLPYRLTVSKQTLRTGNVELKNRRTGVMKLIPIDDVKNAMSVS